MERAQVTSIQIDIRDGLSSSTAIKGPVRCATTSNITLSGEQTIDGVAVVTGDRVLVKDQTTAYENGIYIADTGVWRRSKDFNKTRDVKTGTMVNVTSGTIGAGVWEVTTADPISIGTTNIAFAQSILTTLDIIDEDDMASDSATKVPTQQSVKAYADTKLAKASNLSDLPDTAAARANLDVPPYVADRTALAALDPAKDTVAFVKAAPDQSFWNWDGSNLSAEVAADAAGIFEPLTGGDGTTGAFVTAGARATGGFFTDSPGGEPAPRIMHFNDRIFVGKAVNFNGEFLTAGSPLGFARWTQRDTTFIVGATHGRGAIMGWSKASDGLGTYDFIDVGSPNAGYGGIFVVYNDTLIATREARMWAIYAEARHMIGASATYLAELEVIEYATANPAYPTNIGGAKALGVVIASGGAAATVDPGLGTPQTAAFALAIGYNTADFDKGIIFEDTAIKLTSGQGIAIAFYTGHLLDWFNSSDQSVGRIAVTATLNAQRPVLSMQNNLFTLDVSGASVARFSSSVAGTAPATFLSVVAGVAGTDNVTLTPVTTQTNADLRLNRAGTGRVDIGYDGAAAAVPANFSALFYLPVKVNGTLRYIPYSNVTW